MLDWKGAKDCKHDTKEDESPINSKAHIEERFYELKDLEELKVLVVVVIMKLKELLLWAKRNDADQWRDSRLG